MASIRGSDQKGQNGKGRAKGEPVPKSTTGRVTTGRVTTMSPSEVAAPHRAPKRPGGSASREARPLSPLLRVINASFTVLLLALLVGGGIVAVFASSLDAPGPLAQNKIIVIPRGEETQSIADRLEREGTVTSRNMFVAAVYWARMKARFSGGKDVNLRAGDYEVKAGQSIRGIVETLSEGRTVMTRVTVPEGLTSYQIVERLKADQSLTGDIAEVPVEGTLLPETYVVPRAAVRQTVIDMMLAAQKKLVETAWAERVEGLPFKSPQDAIALASIVEKETGRNDERDRVAAVFVNRLRGNMPLQSDPTILYGLFQGRVQWGKPILRSEIRSNTPHNTYVVPGLPASPICNPGRAAIEATLRPAQTREMYFVADGKGGHVFAETLRDHNANVQRWRLVEKERAARPQAAGAAATAAAAPATGGGTGAAEALADQGDAAATPATAQPKGQPAAQQKPLPASVKKAKP